MLLGEVEVDLSPAADARSALSVEEGDMVFAPAGESLMVARLTALGLEAAESEIRSAGDGLVARSLAQVRDPGRGIDQADPSWGSRGEGVKTGAFAVTSLASRALGTRLGVLTLEVEAVVTASPSIVEGGRPFQTLEGLLFLVTEASDQAV